MKNVFFRISILIVCSFFLINCFKKEEIYKDNLGNNSSGKSATYLDKFVGTYQIACSFASRGSITGLTDYGNGYIWLELGVTKNLNMISLYPHDVALNGSYSNKGLYGKAKIEISENGSFIIPSQNISVYNFTGSGKIEADGRITYTYVINSSSVSSYDCRCDGRRI